MSVFLVNTIRLRRGNCDILIETFAVSDKSATPQTIFDMFYSTDTAVLFASVLLGNTLGHKSRHTRNSFV